MSFFFKKALIQMTYLEAPMEKPYVSSHRRFGTHFLGVSLWTFRSVGCGVIVVDYVTCDQNNIG